MAWSAFRHQLQCCVEADCSIMIYLENIWKTIWVISQFTQPCRWIASGFQFLTVFQTCTRAMSFPCKNLPGRWSRCQNKDKPTFSAFCLLHRWKLDLHITNRAAIKRYGVRYWVSVYSILIREWWLMHDLSGAAWPTAIKSWPRSIYDSGLFANLTLQTSPG